MVDSKAIYEKTIPAKERSVYFSAQPFLLYFLFTKSICKSSIIFSGKIDSLKPNGNGQKAISLSFPIGFDISSKTIYPGNDGSFSDTLTDPEGKYTISDGNFLITCISSQAINIRLSMKQKIFF